MSKAPQLVGTGVYFPGVHFWARVLVSPDRLSQVKHMILTMGQVFLKPGEVLEIETRPRDDIKQAMTVGDPGVSKPFPACLVMWNEFVGDIQSTQTMRTTSRPSRNRSQPRSLVNRTYSSTTLSGCTATGSTRSGSATSMYSSSE